MLIVASVVSASVVGCGESGDDDTNGGPVEMGELPDRYAEAYCRAHFDCCSDQERKAILGSVLDTGMSSNLENCRTTYSSVIEAFILPSIRSAVDAGRASYDADAAGDCLAEVSSSCGNLPLAEEQASSAVCEEALEPKVALGETCKEDFECKAGTCKETEGDSKVCTEVLEEGDPCEFGDCPEGLRCDDRDSETCVALKSAGESCELSVDCSSGDCGMPGSGGASSGERVCQPKKSAGESCDGDDDCKSGYCDSVGTEEGSCLGTPVCDGNNG